MYGCDNKTLQLIPHWHLHILCQGKFLGVSVGQNGWEFEYKKGLMVTFTADSSIDFSSVFGIWKRVTYIQ